MLLADEGSWEVGSKRRRHVIPRNGEVVHSLAGLAVLPFESSDGVYRRIEALIKKQMDSDCLR